MQGSRKNVRQDEFGPKVDDETASFLEEITGIVEKVSADGTATVRFEGSKVVYIQPGAIVKTWCSLKFRVEPHCNIGSTRVEMLPYRE